jgi:hypothetical protein
VLVRDPSLVRDYVAWLESVVAARHLPLSFVTAAFTGLIGDLPASVPLPWV